MSDGRKAIKTLQRLETPTKLLTLLKDYHYFKKLIQMQGKKSIHLIKKTKSCNNAINTVKDIFRTLSKIYDGLFLQKLLKARSRWLFSQRGSIKGLWQSSKCHSKYACTLAQNNRLRITKIFRAIHESKLIFLKSQSCNRYLCRSWFHENYVNENKVLKNFYLPFFIFIPTLKSSHKLWHLQKRKMSHKKPQ